MRAGWGAAAVLLIALVPGIARSQETRGSEFPDLEERGVLRRVKGRLTIANRFIGDSDFGSFSASSYQPEGRLQGSVPLSKRSALRLMASGRAVLYDFDGETNSLAPGGRPFEDLYSWDLRLQGVYTLPKDWTHFSPSERWMVLLQGGMRASWESGSDMSEGIRAGGSLAAGYKLGDTLELALGLTIRSRHLRSSPRVAPLLEFDWQISNRWRLKSYGVGLQLEHIVTRPLRFFARTRLETESYRLGERRLGVGQGAIRIRQVPVGIGIDWRPRKFFLLRLIGGVMTYNELRIRNEDDDTVAKLTGAPAPYVTLRIDIRR